MICADCRRAERQASAFRTVTVTPTVGVKSPSRPVSLPEYIYRIEDATSALELVKKWMKKQGFLGLDNVRIEFASASSLAGSDSANAAARAFPERELIRSQAGYDACWFVGALAHECGHIWLYKQRVPYQADSSGLSWRDEGFCEWIMFNLMCDMDTYQSRQEAAWMLDNPSPYYGDGFRAVKAAADRIGFSKYVAQVKQQRKIVA